MNQKLTTFDFQDIRDRFYVETTPVNKSGWDKTLVKVFDRKFSETDHIYQYNRNYSMLRTFEPFRLWDQGKEHWRHFALISPTYVSFQVLDLDNRKIVATRPEIILTQEQADRLNKTYIDAQKEPPYKSGQNMPGWGFCPSEFHVPDMLDILDTSDLKEIKDSLNTGKDLDFWNDWIDNFLDRRSFGYLAGCVWGDDWSYKVQAIDLTKILEGYVNSDERFGYLVLQGDLKNIYNKNYYDDDSIQRLELSVPLSFEFDKNDKSKVSKTKMYSSLPHFEI